MKARLHAVVYGEVQGVFFRAHTQEKARELGVSGWVMNIPGGCVELEAEGEKEKLEELLVWLNHGPPSANVEKVEKEWKEFLGEFDGFKIRYS